MPQVTLEIPEALVEALQVPGQDLPRTIIEALALAAYRTRKLSTLQLSQLLNIPDRYELDGFLKHHEVWLEYDITGLERDRQTHQTLGF